MIASLLKAPAVEQLISLRRVRRRNDHEIAFGQRLVQAVGTEETDAGRGLGLGIDAQDAHAERQAALRYSFADSAQADDAQRPAADRDVGVARPVAGEPVGGTSLP